MEYSLAIKRTEVLIHATTWMNLEDIMLSKRNQPQKATCYIILLLGNVQIHGNVNKLLVAWSWGRRQNGEIA